MCCYQKSRNATKTRHVRNGAGLAANRKAVYHKYPNARLNILYRESCNLTNFCTLYTSYHVTTIKLIDQHSYIPP